MGDKTDTIEARLFDIAVDFLSKVDRRDFYQNIVGFCARLFDSDVCALFVRTEQIGGEPRVCLVARKLPEGHPDGRRMDPAIVAEHRREFSYAITDSEPYDGITGRIASTGESVIENGGREGISKRQGHQGKWDAYVWQTKLFERMLGVPIPDGARSQDIIGVIKVENKFSGDYTKADEALLLRIGKSLASSLQELIDAGRELRPEIDEYEYRIPRRTPETFERQKTGEVVIKHSMTAICHSDVDYFRHQKPRARLDERLPLVLGHETTGEVYQVVGDPKYYGSDVLIQPQDRVVVIPLIPCWTCEVCTGKYGENYCASSRFMASNAPGSLRTIYKYDPRLILKISDPAKERCALFTEPMSNVVQILTELGFDENTPDAAHLTMAPFGKQEFTYFHVDGESFSSIFDSITSEEPNPRTLYLLKNTLKDTPTMELGERSINHYNLMKKGLGLLGCDPGEEPELSRTIEQPKVLILGGGVHGFILAALLAKVHRIPKDRIVVTGRAGSRLIRFRTLAERIGVGAYIENHQYTRTRQLRDDLVAAGTPGEYDFIFECVGGPMVGANIRLAMEVAKPNGVIGLLGLTDQAVKVDFGRLLGKRLFAKGTYRGSIGAYQRALSYIEQQADIEEHILQLIDQTTTFKGQTGFHSIANEFELEQLFTQAKDKQAFGRLVISELA